MGTTSVVAGGVQESIALHMEESRKDYGACSRYVVKPIDAEKTSMESLWKV